MDRCKRHISPGLLSRILWLAAGLSALLLMRSEPVAAQEPETTEVPVPPTVEERVKSFVENSIFQSLGILTGVVISDEYDTGMGFGGNVSQIVLEPGLKLKTTVYFWGASRDSIDVSSLGIEETLFLQKTPHPRIDVFSGLTAGYYSFEYDSQIQGPDGEYTVSSNDNRFDMYLTTGLRYHYHPNRCFVMYLNYLFTREINEVHLIAGLEFSKLPRVFSGR